MSKKSCATDGGPAVVHRVAGADPFAGAGWGRPNETGRWPASWVGCPELERPSAVVAFRLRFALATAQTFRFHVSGDERYDLFIDGVHLGDGPDRGDALHWRFATYDASLAAGEHVLVARVWCAGKQAPYAQLSVRPGFLLAADAPLTDTLSTGRAAWAYKPVEGIALEWHELTWGTGPSCRIDGATYPWGIEAGDGVDWRPAVTDDTRAAISAAHHEAITIFERLMAPSSLPPMLREPLAVALPDALRAVPARTRVEQVLMLEDYTCGRPVLTVTGGRGATVALEWAEALYETVDERFPCSPKGRRAQSEGMTFVGVGDRFVLNGGAGRCYTPLWWQAGRVLRLTVSTGDDPLRLDSLVIEETRYPFEVASTFDCDDRAFMDAWPIMRRTLSMCMHETYMDCPYYEQLQYVADTRLQALVTYVLSRDDRLPRQAIAMFEASRLPSGLIQARYPSRHIQVIPPLALLWIGMVHDYALWRGDRAFVSGMLPGVRAVVDAFLAARTDAGLVKFLNGWNFMDWVPAWHLGVPPTADDGLSGVMQWLVVLALGYAADLERWVGEPCLAERGDRAAAALAEAAAARFWSDARGCLAEDSRHQHFAEHSQALALLGGRLPPERRAAIADALATDRGLDRATISFSHYVCEALALARRGDALLARFDLWRGLKALGFATTPEQPEPTRSDCHGWGAHPIYHAFASVLGIRPAGFGFETVSIHPNLGPLKRAEGALAHARGTIQVRIDGAPDGGLDLRVTLPEGLRRV